MPHYLYHGPGEPCDCLPDPESDRDDLVAMLRNLLEAAEASARATSDRARQALTIAAGAMDKAERLTAFLESVRLAHSEDGGGCSECRGPWPCWTRRRIDLVLHAWADEETVMMDDPA